MIRLWKVGVMFPNGGDGLMIAFEKEAEQVI